MFALILVTFLLIWFIYKEKLSRLNIVNKIPGPPKIPIIGSCFKWKITNTEFFQWPLILHAQFGTIYRVWALSTPKVIISNADSVEKVLRSPACADKGDDYRFLHDYLSPDCVLVVPDGPIRRMQRTSLLNSLRPCDLPGYLDVVTKHSTKFANCLAELKESKESGVDMFKQASYCSADIFFECSFNHDLQAVEKQDCEYVTITHKLCKLLGKRYTTILRFDSIFNLSKTKHFWLKYIGDLNAIIDKVFTGKLEKNLEDDKKLPIERNCVDFMRDKLPMDTLTRAAHGLLLAGYETTSCAMSWFFFLIGTYPEIQDRIVEELESVFGDSGRTPDMADLARLEYLEKCIKETIRLYPSVFVLERKVTQTLDLGKYLVPAGCDVTIHLYLLHRDPQVWPDPEKFDPERFSPENSQGRHPYAFLPFSAGPKGCVGPKFAMMEMKVLASTVLRRSRLAVTQKREDMKLKVGLILQPETPIRVQFFERETHPNLRVSEI